MGRELAAWLLWYDEMQILLPVILVMMSVIGRVSGVNLS
jgi:hypothetical protein